MECVLSALKMRLIIIWMKDMRESMERKMNTETKIKQTSYQRILDMWNKQRMTIFEKDAEIQKLQDRLDQLQKLIDDNLSQVNKAK